MNILESKKFFSAWETEFSFKLQFLNGRNVTAMDMHDGVVEDYELHFIRRDDALRVAKRLQGEFASAGFDIPFLQVVCLSKSSKKKFHWIKVIAASSWADRK